jgi:hypothetical protein
MNRQTARLIVTYSSLILAVICTEPSRGVTVTTDGGTTNRVPLFTGSSAIGDSAIWQSSGLIGLGTGATAPTDVLSVNGGIDAWGSSAGTQRAVMFFHGGGQYMGLRSYYASSKMPIRLQQQDSTSIRDALVIDASGNVTMGSSASPAALYVNGSVITNGASGESAITFMHAGGHYFSIRSITTNSGKLPISLQQQDSAGVSDRLYINSSGYVGIGTTSPTKPLTVQGNILIQRSNGTAVMELGDGLDYAEGFEVSGQDKPAPGSVLVIDADSAGRLAVSSSAYDSRVAGIVAGAKSLGSGVRLGVGQFDCDVAMAGRVYCNVDATNEPVQPGDLLTTSATAGFAMKAADHARTPGAVLGKAMQGLEKGQKGQILVLVTLQ